MKNSKGQALIVVFMLLLLISLILSAVATMWQTGLATGGLQRDSQAAFYIANAGIEYGKFKLFGDDAVLDWTGEADVLFGGGNFSVAVVDTGGNKRELTSAGNFRNARRVIKIKLGMTELLDGMGNHYGWRNNKEKSTWREE